MKYEDIKDKLLGPAKEAEDRYGGERDYDLDNKLQVEQFIAGLVMIKR